LAALAVRIRNSAQVLQRSAPYDVVHLLNRLFYEVGEPILAAGGEISEYRDAGLIAYFGLDEKNARAKCLAAVRAGLEIVLRLRGFVRYVRDHFGFEPEVGLGVHFGRAIVGSVGHPTRQFVSALGDINPIAFWLTSVEPLNEPYLLATEEIVNQIEDELRLGEVLTGAGPRSFDRNVWEIHDMHKPDGVTLIRRSFEKVLANRRGAADLFYRLLFEIDPSTRALFAHVDLEAQGDKLMEVLGVAVKGLDRLETLVPTLRELGRRHAGYGVELRHFASVEQALLETLSQMLGPEFTPELKGHWSAAIGALAGEMITGGWQQAA
jgi:nitric oxide dioxygenase